jgi:hypothetical protein
VLGDEVVDALEEARLLQIRIRRQAGETAGELRHLVGHPHEPSDEVYPGVGELVEVKRHAGRLAD